MHNLFSDRTDCRWDIYDHTDLPVDEATAVYNNTKINIEVSGKVIYLKYYINAYYTLCPNTLNCMGRSLF